MCRHALDRSIAFLLLALLVPGAGVAAGPKDRLDPRIAGAVHRQVEAARARGMRALPPLSTELVPLAASGMVQVVLHAAGPTGEAEERDLERLGATVVRVLRVPADLPPQVRAPPAGQIQAWVPIDRLEDAAALPWVVAVGAVDPGAPDPHPVVPTTSEGVRFHDANFAHGQGVTGAGVRIGVISDGVTSLAAAQAQSELPAVDVLSVGDGDEGTAMLEILHDMAPGAELLFAATGDGVAAHVNAMMDLAARGAHVVAEDIAFDAQPAFQQGLAAATADAIAAGGVTVHSSAGNRGRNHAARVVAVGTGSGPDGHGGPFAGCAIDPTDAVAIAPGGDTTFDLVLGAGGSRFTLQWSEPRAIFPTAGQGGFTDLDLYVMDETGSRCLFESHGVQGLGVGDTIEQIATPPEMGGTPVKVVVNVFAGKGAAAAPVLDLRWRGTAAEIDAPTRAGSLNPDANYLLATSSAAVNAAHGTIEAFSSGGPVQLGLTTLWNGAGSPGLPGPGPEPVDPGPAWAAADGVAISGVGGFGTGQCPAARPGDCRFYGTSASAPHAAGCDALVRDAFDDPTAPVAFVNGQLAGTAVDLGPPGPDETSGAGQLDCLAAAGAPTARCRDVTVPTDPGSCEATGVGIDDGSFDPQGGPVELTQDPAGPFPLGATLVTQTVRDRQGLEYVCFGTVAVVDDEPPAIRCNAPETIVPPDAPVAFAATATDNCAVAETRVTGFDCFTFTKKDRRVDRSCRVSIEGSTITIADSGGVGDHIVWTVLAVDGSGRASTRTCEVTVRRPGR